MNILNIWILIIFVLICFYIILISDGALREFLKQLHANSEHKFICTELDENHLFIFDNYYPKHEFNNVQEWLQHV